MTATTETGPRIALAGVDGWNADDPVPWLAEAWCAVGGLRACPDAPATPRELRHAIERRWSGAQVALIEVTSRGIGGFIVWKVGTGDTPMVEIHAVAVRRDWRNLGYGGEAIEHLESRHTSGRMAAAVPRWNGLAVYFWLRVGYRPVRGSEDHDRARDRAYLWMMRATDTAVSAGRSDPSGSAFPGSAPAGAPPRSSCTG